MAFPGESVVVEVGKCICNSICTKITTFFKFQPNTDSLRAKMKELSDSKHNIEEYLESRGKQGKVAILPVKEWLPKVNNMEGQWNSMEENIKASQKLFCGCFSNCYLRYKLSKSSMEKIQEVKELINTRANFPEALVVLNPLPKLVEQIPGPSVLVDQNPASRFDHLRNLVIDDDRFRKIGIYGMGGVGKTTLIRELNNKMADGSLKQPFDIIIWVTVSSVINMQGIQSQIADRLKFKEELEKESKQRWATLLLGKLKEKKFLLILDDVWEKIDLDKVGIPQGDLLGCKIILTTRSLDVCNQMETDEPIKVNTLNDEASWELFSRHVGELPDVEEIKSLAREVAKECKGLPLAIKVVGCSMRGKERVEQWRKALRGLRVSQPRNIECVEEDVFGAEGLIDESLNIEESLESGVDLIEKLKHSCMLEPGRGEGTVKMHDIVRDVALWIASSSEDGNKFFVQSNMGSSKITEEGMHESINKASFVGGELSEIPMFLARCSRLSALFLQDNPLNKIARDIFLGLKALRVMNLSSTKIKSLPKEVGELNNLRLLNLSNTYELERIEAHTISRLSSLEVLDMYKSSYGWKVKGEVDEESVTLEELLHLECLYYLGIRDCSVNRIGEVAKSVPNLKELFLFYIVGSDNIWQGMVKSGGRSSFPKLQNITVLFCHGLKNLIPHDLLEQLDNLEEIIVANCSNMKEIFGAKVVDENTSEIVATCSVVDNNAFPKLRFLQLVQLPELRYICQEAFSWPSLEIIQVSKCPNLRRLSFSTGNAKKIQEIDREWEWWNELEWEDEETSPALANQIKNSIWSADDGLDSSCCFYPPSESQSHKTVALQISFLPNNSLSLSLERMAFPGESVVVEVGKCICNGICTKITTFFKFQANTDSLREKMEELSDSKKNIEEYLESAGKQGKVAILPVKDWIPKVNNIEGQWNSMEEDIKASQQHICGCFPNCYSRYKLSKSSMEKFQKVKELIDTRTNFPEELAVPNPRPESVQDMPGPSIVDQKAASELLDRLKELVLNDDIRKIGIWGMGGVGKTTLVSNLNNMMADGSLAHPFDIIIPVTVSSILDLHGIQLQIAERLNFKEKLEKESKGRWATLLLERLKKEKKFLMILDDVWEKIDLDKVGIPQDLLGCKIVLTTRSLDVCYRMKTDVQIRVNTLNVEAGWKLFSEHVGELPDVQDIKSLAREVAKECNGLPLAIKVVGCSMRGKERVEQWRKALRGLRAAQPRNIEGVEEDVFGPLKWSYDSLQGKNIQPCFLYCSLFPEDFSINEDELIRCWRAEGLIDESLNIEESLESGVDLIEKLKHSCMLELGQGKGTVKMHDIVRDVAIWIASSSEDGNKFFVQSNMSLSKITEEWMHESINRASFVGGGLSEIPTFLETCSNLSTLFLQKNPLNKSPKDIFLGLKALRVLNLSGTKIKSLPKEVGELNNLRVLNLSEMRELERIEAQTISRLSSLEVLDMYRSLYGWKVKGDVDEDEESVTLEELLHLECLYYLRIRVSSTDYFPLDSTRLKRLKSFHFHMAPIQPKERTNWLRKDHERVVELTGDAERLAKCAEGMLNIATCLRINDCSVNKIGEVAKSVPNLKELFLFQIKGSDNIWEGMVKSGGRSCFPKLQEIRVIGCHGLKSLIPHDLLEQLHNLEEIYVRNCSNMKEIFGAKVVDENTSEIVATCSVVDSNAFPKLRNLQLRELPELTYICREAFSWPSLEIVQVWGCPNLQRLPFSTGNAKKIQEIKGREEWWNELEWENEETKLNLQKHFKGRK
ncbi:uncharacterized protein LOC143882767 [Tasmannia lanceolata]|uniref:uncharacterized protein LOC143882767 n=1 Tax=Tasmannia lanceolata TaxID=3420 RepID=UPI00406441F9